MSKTTLINRAPDAKPQAKGKISLVGLGRKEIATQLEAIGIEPKKVRMRTKQVFHWIYNYGVNSFDEMTNIAKPCLLYTSPSPRDLSTSRMPSSA